MKTLLVDDHAIVRDGLKRLLIDLVARRSQCLLEPLVSDCVRLDDQYVWAVGRQVCWFLRVANESRPRLVPLTLRVSGWPG